jgi:hypothetical protein
LFVYEKPLERCGPSSLLRLSSLLIEASTPNHSTPMKLTRCLFFAALFACLGLALAAPSAPMSSQQKFENVMAYLTYVLLGISIAGATLTIITFLIFSRIRTYPIKLICWLCLTIAIGQLLFIIVSFTAKGTPWCEPAGALVHFWFMANFCWVRPHWKRAEPLFWVAEPSLTCLPFCSYPVLLLEL